MGRLVSQIQRAQTVSTLQKSWFVAKLVLSCVEGGKYRVFEGMAVWIVLWLFDRQKRDAYGIGYWLWRHGYTRNTKDESENPQTASETCTCSEAKGQIAPARGF